jgi:hypothetical protein
MSFALQMSNVGSEVARVVKRKDMGKDESIGAHVNLALEILAFILEDPRNQDKRTETEHSIAVLKDFFFDGNKMGSTGEGLNEYYDSFLNKYMDELEEETGE